MYEDFFGLQQRPFSLNTQADDFIGIPAIQDVLDSLVHCITQSRGIAVMTSAPGLGKTMLCRRLTRLLEENYRAIYLSAAGMETRLSLLQGVLFELNMGYVGLTDQEARLKLFEAARNAGERRRPFLLIIDEAQSLTPRLFEEIRALTDYAPEGTPLIHAVLSGSFELEEKLADPALTAFSQRIGLQVCLAPLSLQDSARLISERLKASGASRLLDVIDEEALDLICRASDGNPHCLFQLTDHACLLAFANGERPVSSDLVRAALENLKELPLRWSEIPGEESRREAIGRQQTDADHHSDQESEQTSDHFLSPVEQETDEFLIPEFLRSTESASGTASGLELPAGESSAPIPLSVIERHDPEQKSAEFAVFEVGAGLDASIGSAPEEPETQPAAGSVLPGAEALPSVSFNAPIQMQLSEMTETPVLDRYTFLDRIFELPESRRTAEEMARLHQLPPIDRTTTISAAAPEETEDEPILPLTSQHAAPPASKQAPEEQMLEMVQQIRQDLHDFASADRHPGPEMSHSIETIPISPALHPASSGNPTAPIHNDEHHERRFGHLFTRLRLRRQRIEAEQK